MQINISIADFLYRVEFGLTDLLHCLVSLVVMYLVRVNFRVVCMHQNDSIFFPVIQFS